MLLFTIIMSSNFSLGFYANMIKEALEKTISEGKVCLSAEYYNFPLYFIIVISLAQFGKSKHHKKDFCSMALKLADNKMFDRFYSI